MTKTILRKIRGYWKWGALSLLLLGIALAGGPAVVPGAFCDGVTADDARSEMLGLNPGAQVIGELPARQARDVIGEYNATPPLSDFAADAAVLLAHPERTGVFVIFSHHGCMTLATTVPTILAESWLGEGA